MAVREPETSVALMLHWWHSSVRYGRMLVIVFGDEKPCGDGSWINNRYCRHRFSDDSAQQAGKNMRHLDCNF